MAIIYPVCVCVCVRVRMRVCADCPFSCQFSNFDNLCLIRQFINQKNLKLPSLATKSSRYIFPIQVTNIDLCLQIQNKNKIFLK